jgi:signal transduction histidine kinase
VAGCLDGKHLLFSVEDDGDGFGPKECPGVQQGHFGLQGIRERVNQFDGEMSIAGEAGKGARVTIALNMPDGGEEQA